MSSNQLTPVWMTVSGASMAAGVSMTADIATDAVPLQWEDNIGIQVKWTGTAVGTLAVQVSMDPTNLGWITVPLTSSNPAGSAGTDWYEVNQSPAAWVRLIYTHASSTGLLFAKIAIKSV